ncbi:MAG TPA: ABC transporter ATP-binding protein [Polyangiaceae bacterium LLY-WYZ-15_(1-7)]|nr:ABC transporter [Myxococcales bacterium]MAT28735.1 ABC transporter [Sandaracinus sp.]HJK93104.1 ABC transporter ATP-binding protein [Polyangiaceae bacterium LLY-WYZ-15_(1-7)]HJL00985.1 ABC transporter ATP-binding protein [Polyangiaceae bacterium LLY-WYZ-15_(1-7)]HJL07299.1 ABC transporter ATP-binding protein [Polyangiaceae bacterium LLY-WYZ-15_(1-7)]
MATSPPRTERPLRRLWRHARPHRRAVLAASLCSILNRVFDLAPPFLIGMAVDVVVRREGSFLSELFGVDDLTRQLFLLGALNALIWLLESAFQYAYQVRWRTLAQTLQHEARLDAWRHVLRLELGWFEDRSTGGLMAVLNDDVNQLERFLDRGANDILQTLTTVLVIGAAFFVLAPSIAPLAFLPVPLIIWGSFRFQRRLEPRYAEVRARAGDLNASLANDLGGVATIKAFTAEEREVARIGAESLAYRAANGQAIRVSSAFVPLIRMAILVGFTATLVLGGWLTLEGDLEVGTYSVMVYVTQRLLWPLTRLGETFDLYQRAMASTRRIFELLDVEPAIRPGPRTLPEPVRGELAFEGVRFAYGPAEEGHQDVLRGLELAVPAGETHAVVGATGAGKSTLVKLLLRLYEVREGAVRLDGVDVRELDFASLRGAIGLVAQDVFLFHGTVRENVAYGRPDADDAALERAAELAEAREFIEALPDGWETIIGERGQKLSGGQRQRLALARAFLEDPPVLVLDEATSAVDNETEAAIQRSLERVAEGRTTLVIAHRLSTVRRAHRIHVLDAGEVVESGTHEELLALGGLYAALWQVQTGEAAA